jgi:hypothetical protein
MNFFFILDQFHRNIGLLKSAVVNWSDIVLTLSAIVVYVKL